MFGGRTVMNIVIRCWLAALTFALAACSAEETEAPPDTSGTEVAESSVQRPVEGMSFAGTPLYRNDMDADLLREMEARMEPLEARDSLTEDEYIELGALYIAANRFRDSIGLYSRGIEEHPDSFKLRRHRGHRYINLRELENAIVDLREAVRLIGTEHADVLEYNADGAPTGTYEHWTWYHIGLYNYLHGNWEQAAAAYRTCIETATTNQTRVGATDWLYSALRKNGLHEEAETAIAAIPVDIDTNREHPYFKRVMMYKGELTPSDLVDIDKPSSQWTGFDVTAGYGIANWFAAEGDQATADMILGKIVETPFWNSWAYVVTDRELADR